MRAPSVGRGSAAETGPASRLRHPEPEQLWFQITEIFEDETYRRHGVDVGAGHVVFDVGANVGVAAVWFAAERRAARVHSFEPVAPIFELLERNIAPYPACVARCCALGERAGTAAITYYPHADAMSGLHADPVRDAALVDRVMQNRGIGSERRRRQLAGRYEAETMSCEVRTLSEVIAASGEEVIDLLKIDVERSELSVLRGLADSDWPRIRQLVIEVEGPEARGEIATVLDARGFRSAWEEPEVMAGTGMSVVYAVRG
jgi:31-O-methyltransferase